MWSCLPLGVNAFGSFLDLRGLFERNAKRLGAHARGLSVLSLARLLLGLASAGVLDLVLTLLSKTEWSNDDVLGIQVRNERLIRFVPVSYHPN